MARRDSRQGARGNGGRGGSRRRERDVRLSQQVFVLYAAVMLLVIGSGIIGTVVVANRLAHRGAEDRVLSVAQAVAAMPEITAALQSADPTARLQPLAEEVRQRSNVSFVVVMAPDGTRYSHPNPDRIGGRFIGTIGPAVQGGMVVETYEGTLGRSVRAVVPVWSDGSSAPVGLVSVGVLVDRVADELEDVLPVPLGVAALALLVAAVGSWWIARRLSRQTFGMGPAELARVYAHHDAVLHDVREGLLVVDNDRRVVLINDAARQLLGVGPEIEGRPVDELPLSGGLADILASGATIEDQVHLAGERLLVVSQVPVGARASVPGVDTLGTVLTMRDLTQVMALADELSATRSLADALRAHVHESANRLHTVVTLVQMGDADAAVQLATGEVRATQALTSRLVGQFEEPALVALLLGKTAEAARRSVDLVVTAESRLTAAYEEPVDLVTIVGNLVDNAIDAALDGPLPRRVEVTVDGEVGAGELVMQVRDSGPGFSPEALDHAFRPGWSTKADDPDRRQGRGIGMALVQQVVARRGGTVEIGNAGRRSSDGAGNGASDGELSGAVVTVRLPLPAPAEQAPETPARH